MQHAEFRGKQITKQIKRCVAAFCFSALVINSSFAKCEIGNCNDCHKAKSKCACIAMTYFQYGALKHHNYTDGNDFEYALLLGCPTSPSIRIDKDVPEKDDEGNIVYKDKCTFYYVRYRSCSVGQHDMSCSNDSEVITVRLDIKDNYIVNWNQLHPGGGYYEKCKPQSGDTNGSDAGWESFLLSVGDSKVCFDKCTYDFNDNYNYSNTVSLGRDDNGVRIWCMVYDDLRKRDINKNALTLEENMQRFKANGKTVAGLYTANYCDNSALAEFIDPELVSLGKKLDSVNDTGVDKSVVSSINTDASMPFMTYNRVDTPGMDGIGKKSCDAGNVFTDGQCTPCNSKPAWVNYARENRMYCPGLNNVSVVGLSIQDQIKKCPKGMWPNENLTDCGCLYGLRKQNGKCIGSLSYDNMYYGPEGKNAPLFKQCWTKVSEKSYKKCMGFDN